MRARDESDEETVGGTPGGPGAQTERWGLASRTDCQSVPHAGLVRALLGGETSPAALFFPRFCSGSTSHSSDPALYLSLNIRSRRFELCYAPESGRHRRSDPTRRVVPGGRPRAGRRSGGRSPDRPDCCGTGSASDLDRIAPARRRPPLKSLDKLPADGAAQIDPLSVRPPEATGVAADAAADAGLRTPSIG